MRFQLSQNFASFSATYNVHPASGLCSSPSTKLWRILNRCTYSGYFTDSKDKNNITSTTIGPLEYFLHNHYNFGYIVTEHNKKIMIILGFFGLTLDEYLTLAHERKVDVLFVDGCYSAFLSERTLGNTYVFCEHPLLWGIAPPNDVVFNNDEKKVLYTVIMICKFTDDFWLPPETLSELLLRLVTYCM